MPIPLEDHGGVDPGKDFPKLLADTMNKVILIVHTPPPNWNIIPFFASLLLSHIEAILVCIPHKHDEKVQLPRYHPLFEYVPSDVSPIYACLDILRAKQESSVFLYEVFPGQEVPTELWAILRTTPKGESVSFQAQGRFHQLVSLTPNGAVQPEGEIVPLSMPIRTILSEITMDVSQCFTELCSFATLHGTDKTPYQLQFHRHPYTPIYDMFMSTYKYRPSLKVGEIGVLNGSSMRMWQDYFPTGEFVGFDINPTCLAHIESLPKTKAVLVDAGSTDGLQTALQEACSDGKKFDILLEDASHCLTHQLLFLRHAIDFVAPGGLLVIEDIFREIPAARFEEVLREHQDKIAKAILVRPEHTFRFSPGWENDRLLFVWIR